MATKKLKSVRTLQNEIADLQARLAVRDENVDYWHDKWYTNVWGKLDLLVKVNDLKRKLWAAEQEVHDLKYELERRNKEHEYVERRQDELIEQFSFTNFDLNKKISDQDELIDDFIEENLNLHHELILQRDCNRMAHEVVRIVNELHAPPEQIDPPKCLGTLDAMTWSARIVSGPVPIVCPPFI